MGGDNSSGSACDARYVVAQGLWDAILIADVCSADTLNGAHMMHGGCVCYIIDKYVLASTRNNALPHVAIVAALRFL